MASNDFRERLERMERVLYGPSADLLDRIDRENMELGSFLKLYAGQSGAADLESRSSIREDTVVRELARLLADHPTGTLHIVDACCGEGSLARRVLSSIGPVGRIHYCAVDKDPGCIASIDARKSDFAQFQQFRYLQRQVWDLADLDHSAVDLIVLNNALHEIPPHLYPKVFNTFNDLLRPQRGRICIVDMEVLPEDAPESMAIAWRGCEVERYLQAGGFSLELTLHPKATTVYQAHVRRSTEAVDGLAMLNEIQQLIQEKMDETILARRKVTSNLTEHLAHRKWLILTGSIARYADELQSLAEVKKRSLAEQSRTEVRSLGVAT